MNPVLWFDPCELILCSQLLSRTCQIKIENFPRIPLTLAPPVMFACLDPACRKLLVVRPNAAASVLQAIDHQ